MYTKKLVRGPRKQGKAVTDDLLSTKHCGGEEPTELRTDSFTCCITYLDSV